MQKSHDGFGQRAVVSPRKDKTRDAVIDDFGVDLVGIGDDFGSQSIPVATRERTREPVRSYFNSRIRMLLNWTGSP